MRLFCFILVFFLTPCSMLYAQQFNWVKGGGTNQSSSNLSAHPEEAYYTCTDPNGNVYALSIVGNNGIYADTFSRPSGAYGSDLNLFISSYDCSGNMRWAKLVASSSSTEVPFGIVADNSGHVYMAGYLPHGNLHVGYDTVLTSSYQNTAVIQFDTNGHFNWIRFVGDNTLATYAGALGHSSSLALDSSNNIHFFNLMKFGVPITPSIISHWGMYDLKYNQSGSLLSVKRFGLDSTLGSIGSCLDKKSNKVYLTGYRNSVFPGSNSVYVAAFDTGRNQIWMDTMSCPGFEGVEGVTGIAADGAGNIYYVGAGYRTVIYGGDTIAGPIPSGPAATTFPYTSFIMKLDTSSTIKWIKKYRGVGNNPLLAITLTGANKIAAAGYYYIKTSCGGDTLINTGVGQDVFLTVVDTGGNLMTLNNIPGDGYLDYGWSIASDHVGNVYIGGAVDDSIYAPGMPAYPTHGGNTDFFVMKYGIDCNCTSMPVASFTYTGSPSVTFAYTGTTATIDSVRWSFGDGGTATIFSPTHNYTAAGTYHVRVNIYSHCGNDSYFATITIPCIGAPVSAFNIAGITATRNFTYTGTPSAPDSVTWNYGDGGHGAGLTASHTYAVIGSYNVCATVYTPCGNNTFCNTVNIACVTAPVANFTDTGTYVKGYIYTGTSIAIDSLTWNYGDGGHGVGSSVTHTYASLGTYNVCVTAYSPCGSNTVCHTVVVSCPGTPVSSFTYTGTSVIHTTYIGTTAYIDSVSWDFGDGGHGTGLTATHSYAVPDTFHVCATVYTDCGVDSSCTDIIVPCIITPSFTDTGTTVVGFFYNGSTANLDSVVWHFGDGATDTGFYVSHTYLSSDTFHVCELTYTSCGVDSMCSDVIVIGLAVNDIYGRFDNVTVYPNPATNEMNITGITCVTNYRLLSVIGGNLQEGILRKGVNTIQMNGYAPGVYMVELITDQGSRKTFRIIKE